MTTDIDNGDFAGVRAQLGELAYITQGEGLIVLEREAAAILADRLAAWAHTTEPHLLKGQP